MKLIPTHVGRGSNLKNALGPVGFNHAGPTEISDEEPCTK
jgi:hypothetical protein